MLYAIDPNHGSSLPTGHPSIDSNPFWGVQTLLNKSETPESRIFVKHFPRKQKNTPQKTDMTREKQPFCKCISYEKSRCSIDMLVFLGGIRFNEKSPNKNPHGDSSRDLFIPPYLKVTKSLLKGHVFTIPKKVTSRIARRCVLLEVA